MVTDIMGREGVSSRSLHTNCDVWDCYGGFRMINAQEASALSSTIAACQESGENLHSFIRHLCYVALGALASVLSAAGALLVKC